MRRHPRSQIRRPRPTVRGTGFLVAALVAFVLAIELASVQLLLAGIVLAILPVAAMMMIALSRATVGVTRTVAPQVVAAGGTADVTIRLECFGVRDLGDASWRDLAPETLSVQERRPLRLRAGGSAVLQHTVRADTRGNYQLGPLIVLAKDPFGLASGEYALGSARDLLVTPAVIELGGSYRDVVSNDGMARQAVLRASPSADELMAREYQPGDPMRRVHWGATARHGELMVRQEEQRNNPEAWIVFDTVSAAGSRASGPDDGGRDFERAVDLVASLGVHLLDDGFTVSVIETAHPQLFAQSSDRSSRIAEHPAASFQLPGGDQQLLRELAGVDQVAQSGDIDETPLGRSGGPRGPARDAALFAVLVTGAERDIRTLAQLPSSVKPAIAFLLGQAVAAKLVLANAGWLCVPFDEHTAIDEVWRTALDALEAHDG